MTTSVRAVLVLASAMIAVVALAFWLDTFQVTGGDVRSLLVRLNWWTVPVIFVLLGGHIALSAVRWRRIEVALGGKPQPFGRAFLSGAWALGLGTFLPGPLANVVCRGISNRVTGSSGVRGALSGALDQIADVAVIALFAIPAGLAFVTHSPVTYVVGAGLAAIAGWKISAALSADNPRVFTQFLSSRVPRLVPLFTPGLLSKIYALSLMRLANLTAITLMVHLASEAGTVGATLVAVPLVTLAISAAMLPGSFGVAEWSFTGVFAGFGTSAGEITAFVLANRLILTSLGILIGLFAALVTARKLVTANRISPPEMQLP